MKRLTIGLLATVLGIATSSAAGIYIGDVPAQGQAVTPGGSGPDTANGGLLTYAFFNDGYTNTSGGAELLEITEVNFQALNPGNLTPFVAVFSGAGNLGGNYNVLAKGDPIAGAAGLNNAAFTVGGSNPTVTLNNGETLVGGFYQDAAMIQWEDAPDADYLSDFGGVNGGDNIPAGGGPLGDDANWSSLNREYRFNVGLDVVPEPSVPALLGLPVLAFALCSRSRRRA